VLSGGVLSGGVASDAGGVAPSDGVRGNGIRGRGRACGESSRARGGHADGRGQSGHGEQPAGPGQGAEPTRDGPDRSSDDPHAAGPGLPPRQCRPRPPKLYRIGEVVEYSRMSRQTIHNYSTMGLIHEVRWTDGGHRLYEESVFERLDQIAELKARRKSLRDICEHFARLDGL